MFPAVVRSSQWGGDLNSWLSENSRKCEQELEASGALLFKQTGIDTPDRFETFARLLSRELPDFKEESSPRSPIAGAVQTSTDYPNTYPIQFHSEYSYASRWPMKLFFCCFRAPDSGGETPISDNRVVLANMKSSTRSLFEEKGVLYVRNYRPHVGVSWQKAFSTEDRNAVERSCSDAQIEYEWRPDGILRTRQYGEAIVRHPTTGEYVWFNHGFFFNVHAFEPKEFRAALTAYPEDDPMSTNTLFGDGSPIGVEIIEELRSLYERASARARWEQGDVLLVDNMLSAHGRGPFTGKRSIAVVMADAYSRATLRAQGFADQSRTASWQRNGAASSRALVENNES